ncbi:hypothetical protein PF011_g2320 [Phytophthora fragariae]|uniref:Kinesin motor domain-containing protein n=1 Tax=Phytophthora fragariae TaxID=53985 RepID=A0A6A3MBC4_9STRA|nr:hypothetical protein PF011_g2320 [Phytophthora fragariae]
MTDPSSDLRRLSSCSVSSNHDAPPPPPTPTNVQVAVRCRPLNSREKAAGRGAVVQCRPNSSEVAVVKRKTYTFDRVFGQYSTQKDVFTSVVRPAVDEALAGYNCTVFAYGQTGTGKTYTMQGDLSPSSEMAGIIPRSVRCIFDALEASGEEFSVRVSFLQLYNEELKDLLDPDADKKLRLMEDAKRGGVYCVNLLEVTATTAKHVYELVNSARLKDGVYLPLEQFTDMQERLAGQGAQLSELEDMLKARNTSCKELEEAGEKHASEVAALTLANQEVSIKLVATESELTATKEMLEETKQELQQVQTKLKAYQHNEKMLLDSGSAAAKLYTDSEKRAAELVAKIESTQRIENANTSLATLYRNESQSQINEYLERLAKQKENQEGIFQDVSNALHELQTNHATNLDGLVTSLNALQGLVDARTAQVTESVAEDSAQKRVQRDEVTASVKEQQEAMEQQIEKLVEMSKNYAADVLEDLATSKSRTVAFLESMDLAVEGSREELNSFLTEQSDKLLELQVTIDMSIEKQTKELDESKAALTAALKDSHARQQEELNGMKAHLAQYIDKCLQSQTQKLDEQTIIIEENAKKQQKQLSNIQSITEQEMKTFVQAMGSHNSKHDSETAILRERFSKLRGQIGDANMRQTNLAQSHEQLQTTWINDVAALAESHTQSMTTLMERHAQTDMEISTTKQKQLTQFLSDHDDIRQLLNGGRNTLDKELQNHLSSTRSKIDSVSVLGKDIVGAAGEASNQQLEAMEEYMKNRRITSRTGATPMKKDDRPFPTFEATSVPAEKMMSVENSSSISNLSGAETLAGHKRRRLSDACPVTADDVMPAAKDAPEQSENVAPIRAESTWTANASTSSSSQESKNPDSASATESRKATGPPAETKTSPSVNTTPSKIKPNVAVNTTPSKIKRSGSSALHKKKPVVAHPHRSMKVPSAGAAARKTSRASALAAPKRYRAKSPLG